MKCLLDTHAFLYWVDDDRRLSKKARTTITKSDCYVSLVSAWELAIKQSIGKIQLALPVVQYFEKYVAECGFDILGIELEQIARVESLPHHHGDPFDRLLIAQAMTSGLSMVSADEHFVRYGIKCIW